MPPVTRANGTVVTASAIKAERAVPYNSENTPVVGNSAGTPVTSIAMCEVHNKRRAVDCLIDEGGLLKCTEKNACKVQSTPVAASNNHNNHRHVNHQVRNVVGKGVAPAFVFGAGKGMGKGKGMMIPPGHLAAMAAADMMLCSIHGKRRALTSMIPDAWGYYQCYPGHECKMSSTEVAAVSKAITHAEGEMVVCVIHSKNRLAANMELGPRGWQCKEGYECKVKERVEQEHTPMPMGMCCIHKKQRIMTVLEDNENGELQCIDGETCKESMRQENQGNMEALENGLMPTDIVVCSMHEKRRIASAMVHDGVGGYCCHPEEECQMGTPPDQKLPRPEFGLCSTHQKTRAGTVLKEDGMGGWRCYPGKECK